MIKHGFDILLVEDSPSDALLCRAALVESGIACQLHHVEDGSQGMAFLRQEGMYTHMPRPDLIFLDLNLPVLNGHEVLRQMKSDPALLRIPVVVLTTSQAPDDIYGAYGLHANCYVTKPIGFEEYTRAMRTLAAFWLQVATLPSDYRRELKA